MNKLQYDSFYKFIISAGIILIVTPLFCLHYLVSGSYDIIITQKEEANFSKISSELLTIKVQYLQNFFKYFPCLGILFITIGTVFILWGCIKWHQIQKTLDQITKLNLQEKELHIQSMSSKEIAEKVINENIKNLDSSNPISYSTVSSRIKRAFEIEDACYNYLTRKLKRNYHLHQNVKVGKCQYDIIASSKKNDTDLLYEIKYWKNSIPKQRLIQIIEQVENLGIEYHNSTQRNFHLTLLVICSKDALISKNILNDLIIEKKISFISVEFITEKQLFYEHT